MCGVIKYQLTLEPLIEQTWPLGSSEIVDFGAVRSWLILDTTLIEARLLGYLGCKKRLIEVRQCLKERSVILRSPGTRLVSRKG